MFIILESLPFLLKLTDQVNPDTKLYYLNPLSQLQRKQYQSHSSEWESVSKRLTGTVCFFQPFKLTLKNIVCEWKLGNLLLKKDNMLTWIKRTKQSKTERGEERRVCRQTDDSGSVWGERERGLNTINLARPCSPDEVSVTRRTGWLILAVMAAIGRTVSYLPCSSSVTHRQKFTAQQQSKVKVKLK